MPCKVTLQTGRKGHAAHNDRSMYPQGLYDISNNLHWDWQQQSRDLAPAKPGRQSVNAERDYYTTRYADLLDTRNQKRIKQGHHEDVLTMAQWSEKNPPHETILQIGKTEDNTDPALKRAYAASAARLFRDEVERAGGEVISIDIHMDEASPHAHVRWVMNDETGKPNARGCLSAHGFATAKNDRKNNPMKLWTAHVRDTMEEMAQDMGATLDQNRISRKNLTVRDFKAQEAIKEAQKYEKMAQKITAKKKKEIAALDREIEAREKHVKELRQEEKNIQDKIAQAISNAEAAFRQFMQVIADKNTTLRDKINQVKTTRNAIKHQRETLRGAAKTRSTRSSAATLPHGPAGRHGPSL